MKITKKVPAKKVPAKKVPAKKAPAWGEWVDMPVGSEAIATFDLGVSHFSFEENGVEAFVVDEMKRNVELKAYFSGKEINASLSGDNISLSAGRFWTEFATMDDIECGPVIEYLHAYFTIPKEDRELFKVLDRNGLLEANFSATLEVGELQIKAISIEY